MYDFERDDNEETSIPRNPYFSNREYYPIYDDGITYFPETRTSSIIPYAGYYSDVTEVTRRMNRDPPKNIIQDFLNSAWAEKENEVVSFVETNAIRRAITYKERLAETFHKRICSRLCKRVFKEWFRYSFRYVTIRNNLLRCYQITYTGRRFYEWRRVARVTKAYRKIFITYWNKCVLIRFRWWKNWMIWERHKGSLYRTTFGILLLHTQYQNRMKQKWGGVIRSYLRLKMAIKIQKAFRIYKLRYYFWSMKAIKNVFMKYFLIKLIKRRRLKEKERNSAEQQFVSNMIERGHLYMRKLLQKSEGKELLWTYIREVNDRYTDSANRATLFPDKSEMPEINMKWTARGKAMHILRCRTAYEISEFAKAQFRENRPPIYVCYKCDQKFVLRAVAYNHKNQCKYVFKMPQYVSWKLSRPLVDAALAPIAQNYYKQKGIENARKEARRLKELEKATISSTNLLDLALQKPDYENLKIKPQTSKLKFY